jgi:effector-binding domain-containing protein
MENFGKIECVSLPEMLVASYEVTSGEPEQTAIQFMENWLKGFNLKVGEKGVRNFGFDCHKGREIPDGCRIYHVYFTIPQNIEGDSNVEIKKFLGGNFARIIIKEPFSCDFIAGWGKLLKWVFENNIENRLGCTTPDDCYSLFSNEDTPCLEEIYQDNGVQYMAMYLPIK